VALQLGDLGHSRAANHPADATQFANQALAFFDTNLKRTASSGSPAAGAVTAFLQSCPRTAPRGGGPITASSFARLARGSFRLTSTGRQTVTSSGGNAALSQQLSPLQVDECTRFPVRAARGTAVVTGRTSSGFTLIGRTTVSAGVSVRGSNAQLVGRLWDVDTAGRQRLIDRGVVRLRSSRTVSFSLNGNGWRFARGHRARVEVLGRDAPTYRPSNGTFSVRVTRLRATLPTRERRPR
jgi:hypothetical protein